MTTSSPDTAADFDLGAIAHEMRAEDAYAREGHTARTLVREPDLRVVLVAMRAGSVIKEHRAAQTASIHCLAGHLRLEVRERLLELPAGRLLVLGAAAPHDVQAADESLFLLTLGWRPRP